MTFYFLFIRSICELKYLLATVLIGRQLAVLKRSFIYGILLVFEAHVRAGIYVA